MKKLNKKGIEWKTIATLLIILAFLLFALLFFGALKEKMYQYAGILFG